MSLKYDRHNQINQKVVDIIEDPATLAHLARQLIRPRPKYLPRLIWYILLRIVMSPETRKKPQ